MARAAQGSVRENRADDQLRAHRRQRNGAGQRGDPEIQLGLHADLVHRRKPQAGRHRDRRVRCLWRADLRDPISHAGGRDRAHLSAGAGDSVDRHGIVLALGSRDLCDHPAHRARSDHAGLRENHQRRERRRFEGPAKAGKMRLIFLLAATLWAQDPKAEAEARKAMDAFMTAFNSGDPVAWAGTFNYPHVRLASGTVRVFPTPEDFARDEKDYPRRLAPWHHSAWESMSVVQSGKDKVHFAVTFVRFDASGKVIGKFPSLYVVTLQNGHWGVHARSSYAP